MSLYSIYIIGFLIALFLAAIWSFVDKQKPPAFWDFLAKLIARALVLFVLLVIIVGFFALVMGGLPTIS